MASAFRVIGESRATEARMTLPTRRLAEGTCLASNRLRSSFAKLHGESPFGVYLKCYTIRRVSGYAGWYKSPKSTRPERNRPQRQTCGHPRAG